MPQTGFPGWRKRRKQARKQHLSVSSFWLWEHCCLTLLPLWFPHCDEENPWNCSQNKPFLSYILMVRYLIITMRKAAAGSGVYVLWIYVGHVELLYKSVYVLWMYECSIDLSYRPVYVLWMYVGHIELLYRPVYELCTYVCCIELSYRPVYVLWMCAAQSHHMDLYICLDKDSPWLNFSQTPVSLSPDIVLCPWPV